MDGHTGTKEVSFTKRNERMLPISARSRFLHSFALPDEAAERPEGDCGRNKLLDGSCLSSKNPSVTDEWHVSTATSLHQRVFPDVALLRLRSPSFES